MGGLSAERSVSLRSGAAVAPRSRAKGYRVTRSMSAATSPSRLAEDIRPDVCFNALHSRYGEDGCIQGILERR